MPLAIRVIRSREAIERHDFGRRGITVRGQHGAVSPDSSNTASGALRPRALFVDQTAALCSACCRLRGVELSIPLFDTAGPLVPGNRGTDMVRASPLAGGGDFMLRLAGCQGKDLIAEARRAALATRLVS